MYFKIAFRNIMKSYKDYGIYFVTVILSICIFYAFNSTEAQKAIMYVNIEQSSNIDFIERGINKLSILISIVLACLILYANYNIVKKRKNEFGIYNMLGMGKLKMSIVLTIETFIVAIVSLIIGIILGVFLSQILLIITSKFFLIKIEHYRFIISFFSFKKTVLCFGIMFVITIFLNCFMIARCKIIDLMKGYKKVQREKMRNPKLYLVVFTIGIVVLISAYYLAIKVGLSNYTDERFMLSIVLGIVGTILFFYGLSGFILVVLKKSKSVYYRGLNIFTVKQINSKINTNFLYMSLVCILMFFSMIILSTGLNLKNAMESAIKMSTPFDFTDTYSNGMNKDSKGFFADKKNSDKNYIQEQLKKLNFKFDKSEKHVFFNEYSLKKINLFNLNKNMNKEEKERLYKYGDGFASFIKLSDYNKLKEISGENKIKLKDDEIMFISNVKPSIDYLNSYLRNTKTFNIDNKVYRVYKGKTIEDTLKNTNAPTDLFTIVTNDKDLNKFDYFKSNLAVNYTGDKVKSENKFAKAFRNIFHEQIDGSISADREDKVEIYNDSRGFLFTFLYIGIFIGLIFIICSMSMLALQQLSEGSDSMDKYSALRKLGVSSKMINGTIFKQILVHFLLPFVLAIIHTVIGTFVSNDLVTVYNRPNILISSLTTLILFIIFYIIYFYVTYIGYKRIVNN